MRDAIHSPRVHKTRYTTDRSSKTRIRQFAGIRRDLSSSTSDVPFAKYAVSSPNAAAAALTSAMAASMSGVMTSLFDMRRADADGGAAAARRGWTNAAANDGDDVDESATVASKCTIEDFMIVRNFGGGPASKQCAKIR